MAKGTSTPVVTPPPAATPPPVADPTPAPAAPVSPVQGDMSNLTSKQMLDRVKPHFVSEPKPPVGTPPPDLAPPPAATPPPVADPTPAPAAPAEPPAKGTTIPSDVLPGSEPAPVAPVEPAPDIDTSKLSEKDQNAYASMRTRIKELETQIIKNERQIATPSDPAKLETEAIKSAHEERDKALQLVAKLNLSKSPAFQAKYDSPIKGLLEQGKTVLKDFELDESIMDAATALGAKSRQALLADKAEAAQTSLAPILIQIDVLRNQKNAELETQALNIDRIQAEETSQHEQMVEELKTTVLASSVDEAIKEGNFVFAKSSTDTEWNKGVDSLVGAAREILTSGQPDLQTKTLVLGVAAPAYLRMFMTERNRAAALEEELRQLQGVAPVIGSGSPPAPAPPGSPPEKGERVSAADAAAAIVRGMRAPTT